MDDLEMMLLRNKVGSVYVILEGPSKLYFLLY